MRWKFLFGIGLVFLMSLMFVVKAIPYEQVGSVNISGLKAGGCIWPKGTDDGDSLAGYNGTAPVSIGDFDLTYLHLYAADFYYDDQFIITINNKVVFISVGRNIQTYITPPPNIYLGVDINDFEWNPPLGHDAYSTYPLCPSGSKCEKGIDFPCSQQLPERCPSGVQETEDLDLYINLSSLESVIGSPPYFFRIFATGDNNVAIDCNLSGFTLEYGYYAPSCGDGNIDVNLGEECDDGNLINGDGCSSTCKIEFALTYANWTDINENVINQINVNNKIYLIAKGAPDSTLVNFSIYTISNSLVTSKVSSINEGVANVSWTLSVTGNYYFNASIVSDPGISIISGNLNVISGLCSPTNCQQTLDSLDIDGAVDIWGSWPNGTCSGSIDCDDCSIGSKIIDTELNPNGGICIKNINYCSDYNVTNFGSLLAAEGNCENDPLNVARDTIEIEQGKGGSWCGSIDSDGCIRTCFCQWKDIDGTEQCVGNSGRENCPNPGDNGICGLIGQLLIKDCDQPPLGFRNITYYYQWIGGGSPDPECKDANVLTRCISRTTLNFISTSALIVAVIIIVVFYLIVVRKTGKRKK